MKRSLLIFCILISCLFICGCTYFSTNNSKNTIPSDKYVAIKEEYNNVSTLIGTPPLTVVQPVPIPTPVPIFDYDNSKGWLKYELKPYGITANDSLKILVGKISSFNTPTTLGYRGLGLTGVYTLPYIIDDEFNIENVTSDGTIIATYKNQSILLKPGENWTITLSANITGAYLANTRNTKDYWGDRYMMEIPWPVHSELTYRFTNEGMFNKSILNDSYAK